MAEPTVTLDILVDAARPALEAAGFENAGSGAPGPYTSVRFRRQETHSGERYVRLVTLAHAPEDQAFLAWVDLVARRTYTYTPAGKDLRRYGTPAEAATVASELAAAVRGWVDA